MSLITLFMGSGTLPQADIGEKVRSFTRSLEFDYVSWTLDAFGEKIRQASQASSNYLDDEDASGIVRDYIANIREIQILEAELEFLHSDPEIDSLGEEIADLQNQLKEAYRDREEKGQFVENILQNQLGIILSEFGLTYGGQAIPPVLFHSTPLPWALIVSPRNEIRQEANISLLTKFSLADQIALEDEVAEALDVSTLVVPVGGIGSYPTMIAQSSNLNWLAEVIAHEWIHNYLTLRPLGLLYERNQQLRTMNETAANLAGKELGAALIKAYYPEFAPPPPIPVIEQSPQAVEDVVDEIATFDFRAEMHATRIEVDALLAEEKTDEAETYMEEKRQFFWDNGYAIRKLNQAYFAFYGSYADQPSGPAGADPVGEAVRALRDRSPNLESFLQEIAFLTSFESLERKINSIDE